MADIVRPQIGQVPPSMQTRYVDMGDGTHALRLYIAEINVNSLRTIDTAHVEVHEGKTFRAWLIDTALANDGTLDILFTTGATNNAHISIEVAGGGDGLLYIYKNPTTSGGTPFTPVNVNQASSNISTVTVLTGVTVSDTGTLINNRPVPGGTGGNAGGSTIVGSGVRANEDVWATETNYLIRGQNISGQAALFGVDLQWYEEG